MNQSNHRPVSGSRRRFLASSAAAAALGAGCAVSPKPKPAGEGPRKPYNIVLITSDQERWFDRWPFPAPGRERLRRLGVSFDNHQINSNVCSPSRSVIYTGQHIQHTGVFDNVNTPWQSSMSTDIPTLGHMLREAGYYTGYKGKCHLAKELEEANDADSPQKLLTEVMEGYGFSDYFNVGDIIASTRGGYEHDGIITAMALGWLRAKGRPMSDENQPWMLAVNLINPHDIMYVDTDLPGESVQKRDEPVMEITPPPDTDLYRATWDTPLPPSRHQAWDAPGRPQAHWEFQRSREVLLGTWPDEDRRWRLLQDYYFNCIRDNDRHVVRILDELQTQGLLENTIVIFTSDHGELCGAHQMHGKGSCVYREQNHVPLVIVHPEVQGGQRCKALTSHVDLAPTILRMAGATPGDALKGCDIAPLLEAPRDAGVNELREGSLFNFNMLGYLDGEFLRAMKKMRAAKKAGKAVAAADVARVAKPALEKRGAIRSWFDGRYRFSRYFSPRQHHLPVSVDELFERNDVELFDLENDPHEMTNLASDRDKHHDLLDRLNKSLNKLIEQEVGKDDGSMLPLSKKIDWDLDAMDV
ncbi:MAG: sulfatase-like hydrolase/transferase [Planctomycetes bacterium]|nr:sulfatase-like hydrolase/transferase [Planctomycetota bacterium]